MDPEASATRSSIFSRLQRGSVCSARIPRTSSSVSRLRRTGAARERIVGNTRRGSRVVRTIRAPAGGSSNSFSVAFAASGLDS